jgi:hypothetical protein
VSITHLLWSFFFNNDSATQTQHQLTKRFNTGINGKVPIRQTILHWVSQFKSTAFLPKKNPGRP